MAIPYLLIGNIDERGTLSARNRRAISSDLNVTQVTARAESVDASARQVVLDNGSRCGL
jgi:hypothetical protein